MTDDRTKLISIMIGKCGFNPKSIISEVESGRKERVDYELGGISVYREGDEILARVDNFIISKEPILYRWRI